MALVLAGLNAAAAFAATQTPSLRALISGSQQVVAAQVGQVKPYGEGRLVVADLTPIAFLKQGPDEAAAVVRSP